MNRANSAGEDFVQKDFVDYAVGFGNLRGNFWIGKKQIIKK